MNHFFPSSNLMLPIPQLGKNSGHPKNSLLMEMVHSLFILVNKVVNTYTCLVSPYNVTTTSEDQIIIL